jgi:hypothetical protein
MVSIQNKPASKEGGYGMVEEGKAAYQQKVAKRLEKLKSRLTLLESQIDKTTDEVQTRYGEQLDQIKSQYQQAKEKVKRLNDNDGSDWQSSQADIDQTLDQVREAIDTVMEKLNA